MAQLIHQICINAFGCYCWNIDLSLSIIRICVVLPFIYVFLVISEDKMADNRSLVLTMWNSEVMAAFSPFGGTTADNILEYFLGTPEIATNVCT